jgi:Protein of unknown function with HXXEE motif
VRCKLTLPKGCENKPGSIISQHWRAQVLENWVFYALFGAAALHVVEEYAFPGGFPDFMRKMAGRFASSVNTPFAVIINGLFLILCAAGALLSDRLPLFSLSVAGLCGINGLSHLAGSLRARRYVPGLATGLLLYLPLAVWAYALYLGSGGVTGRQAAGTVLAGLGFQIVPLVYLGIANLLKRVESKSV